MQSSLDNSDNYQSVLSYVLRLLRFRANVFFQSNYCGEWVANSTGTGHCTFHVVDGGECWLHMPILSKPVKLKNGDLLLFPHDALHVICDNEALPAESIEQKKLGAEGKVTALICGYFEYNSPQANPISQALPEWILVNGEGGKVINQLGEIMAIMQRESGEKPCGFESVVDRLSEVLFIFVVRHYLGAARPQKGLLGALLDVRIGDAFRKAFKQVMAILRVMPVKAYSGR